MKTRLSASTIPEVVIAMVIILVIFSIAMMIFINVSRSSLSAKRVYAESIVRGMLIRSSTGDLSQDSTEVDDLHIRRELTPVDGKQGLQMIVLTAFDNDKNMIVRMSGIIAVKEKDEH